MNDVPPEVLPVNTGGGRCETVDRLAALADEMEAFLCDQIGRLKIRLPAVANAADAPQARLETLVADFEEQRASWELLRQQEQSRLRQEGAALTEAWLRLEGEQRQLFAERERLRSGVTSTSLAHNRSGGPTTATSHQAEPMNRPQTEAENPTTAAGTTWWQLEQLRLEMQKHARRGAGNRKIK